MTEREKENTDRPNRQSDVTEGEYFYPRTAEYTQLFNG